MCMQPKVTVLMAEYNTKEEELRQSIESILNQTYKNFEFIIIDDFSEDKSMQIIKSYNDDRIKIYRNDKNIGLAESLNRGIKLASTDFIIRMDTDDIALEDRIEKQVEFAVKHPEYSIVSGKANCFGESRKIFFK